MPAAYATFPTTSSGAGRESRSNQTDRESYNVPQTPGELRCRVMHNLHHNRSFYPYIIASLLILSFGRHSSPLLYEYLIWAWCLAYFFRETSIPLLNCLLGLVTIVCLVMSGEMWPNLVITVLNGSGIIFFHAALRIPEEAGDARFPSEIV